jgi:hypothetical protein
MDVDMSCIETCARTTMGLNMATSWSEAAALCAAMDVCPQPGQVDQCLCFRGHDGAEPIPRMTWSSAADSTAADGWPTTKCTRRKGDTFSTCPLRGSGMDEARCSAQLDLGYDSCMWVTSWMAAGAAAPNTKSTTSDPRSTLASG